MDIRNTLLICSLLVAATLVGSANAASLTQTDWAWLGAQNAAGTAHNISVFAGSAGYAGSDDAGAPTSGTFGDGTVLAYRFFNDANNDEIIDTFASGGGLISNVTTTDTDIVNASVGKVWETTDPVGFTTTANYTSSTMVLGLSDAAGSIDISGLDFGVVYFLYGNYRGTPSFDLTMKDTEAIAADVDLADAGDDDFANNFEAYVVEISFVNDLGYDTIEFDFSSSNVNGRLTGIVVDGITSVPEPASLALLGLGVLVGLLVVRRRKK